MPKWEKGKSANPNGRPRKARITPVIEGEYQESHTDLVVQLLAEGNFDYQVMARLGIVSQTWYRWQKDYPEFAKAVELGEIKSFDWWLTEGKKRFADRDDKGFKFWISIMNNKFARFGWQSEYAKGATQININNNTLVTDKTPTELLESIKANFSMLQQHTKAEIIDIMPEIKTLTDGSETIKED